MKPLRAILAAIVLLVGAGIYLYSQELCGDCTGDRSPAVASGTVPSGPVSQTAVPDFDYYVLSLSWSPSYCEAEATDRDKMQCGGRPFAFIVHGLWPQNEKGYPEDCPTDAPRVPDALVAALLDIMPSRGLIGHEWRSHGACTGMSQEDYFTQVRGAYAAIAIPVQFQAPTSELTLSPTDIARAFLDANNGNLDPGDLVVTCGGGTRLDEVRLCLTKDLHFRACGRQTMASICRRDAVRMPPVRGGG